MSLYGLVICGGLSTRMGSDKSTLVYYEKPQYEHVADLLSPLCEHVAICCNSRQAETFESDYELLPDLPAFAGAGPMTALLSAWQRFPGNDFLVAGCDYPFLTTGELAAFLHSIDKNLMANAFYNAEGWFEPLLAWYSRAAAPALVDAYAHGLHSLQRFLSKHNAGQYRPVSAKTMQSVNTAQDFQKVKKELASGHQHG